MGHLGVSASPGQLRTPQTPRYSQTHGSALISCSSRGDTPTAKLRSVVFDDRTQIVPTTAREDYPDIWQPIGQSPLRDEMDKLRNIGTEEKPLVSLASLSDGRQVIQAAVVMEVEVGSEDVCTDDSCECNSR